MHKTRIMAALAALFGDTSQPAESTRDDLREIIEQCEEYLETLSED